MFTTLFLFTKKTCSLIQCKCLNKTLKGCDYISTNDYILNLLNIKDNNIFISSNKLETRVIKGIHYKIIEAFLTYIPTHCPCCRIINHSNLDIIKWWFRKNCKVKISPVSHCKSLLLLHKQRFFCKHCHNTFIADTNLVVRNKNASSNSELLIRLELMKKQSEKDIAERTGVSVSKVDSFLNNISSHTVLRCPSLPIHMNWDEFKATKDNKGKMAFIIVDNILVISLISMILKSPLT